MGFGWFGLTNSNPSTLADYVNSPLSNRTKARTNLRRCWLASLSLLAIVLFLVAALSLTLLLIRTRAHPAQASVRAPTEAISRACRLTLYPSLCLSSLLDFPGALDASEGALAHISINLTHHHLRTALENTAVALAAPELLPLARAALDDCLELLDSSLDHLHASLHLTDDASATNDDVITWLSAALTNQDTCDEALKEIDESSTKRFVDEQTKDLAGLVSNSLAIFSGEFSVQPTRNKRRLLGFPGEFSGEPEKNKRRPLGFPGEFSGEPERKKRGLLGFPGEFSGEPENNKRRLLGFPGEPEKSKTRLLGVYGEFPEWVSPEERRLLGAPAKWLEADLVVSKNGENGSFSTVGEAVKAAPEYSSRRTVIYVKGGRYRENVKVGRKKRNLMFVGDGAELTVISGDWSVADHLTTFRTATFATTGHGFIMRDMTIENTAGPEKHQAVALRVGADHSVIYRCKIVGYQDTLYAHSLRQFYRECHIFGTVDFIFGNAAVVLQNCTIWARKPLPQQKNTITAQGRKDPNQNTGISIHNCRLIPTAELKPARSNFSTFLGRPWKPYSRVVFMLSYIDEHVDSSGWLEWNGDFGLGTLYYGEYMNYGPGAGLGKRVKWPGYRVITLPEEADKFTVKELISGFSWLPSTGVSFLAGLEPQQK